MHKALNNYSPKRIQNPLLLLFIVMLNRYKHLISPFPSFLIVLWSEKELHDAAKRNDTEKIEELVKRGVDVKAKSKVSLLKDTQMLFWASPGTAFNFSGSFLQYLSL